MPSDTRQLTLLDCFGLGVNGIIGSGIFLLPAALYRRAGGASPLAWLLVGSLCALVALCFAEAAGRTDRSGGPYRYACDAYGPHVGFAVGWITLVSSLLGYAAVSRGFAEHAAGLFYRNEAPLPVLAAVIALLVVGLGVINVIGLRPSARVADTVGVVKLLGLFAFVVVGLFFLQASRFHAAPAPKPNEAVGLFPAAFAGLFACTGFEYVPVPAGETVRPQRAVGLAMVVSVLGATVLYAIVQSVAVGTSPNLGGAQTPLVAAARAFAGPIGGAAMAAIGVVSAFGFCSTSALVVPRYVETFAQDRFLPPWLERRSARFGTPVAAVVVSSLVVVAMAITLDFTQLADTSNVAVVVQYVSTCVAILVMRRRDPAGSGFRIPLGPTVPILATLGCTLFMFSVAKGEIVLSAVLCGGGLVLGLATRWLRRVV
jgi:amino acid transporter